MADVGEWTSEEEKELLCLVKKHTITSIVSRLKTIAVEMYKSGNGKPLQEIAESTKLLTEDINKLLHTNTLQNQYAEWDIDQDTWLKKYINKHGVSKCASKMGRLESEIQRRLLYLAMKAIDNNIPIETVCSELCLNKEDFQNKLKCMDTYVSLEDIDKITSEPPYYVVLNGRRNGVYSDSEGFKMATIGVEGGKYKKCNTFEDMCKYMGITYTNTEVLQEDKPEIVLSPEQNKVIEDVLLGKNILLLGSAGVGKSFVIKHITKLCKEKNISIGITSSTGCSAILIDGKTIHSYLGIGLASSSPAYLAKNLYNKNKKKLQELQNLDILLIDEISMLDAELLTKISKYLSIVRNDENPFGGVQIIFSGDFYQLPPVHGMFAFKSEIWDSLNLSCHILKKIYRQEGDQVFQGILERAKYSSITDEDIEILKKCNGQFFRDDVKPTSLYPINATVDKINNEEYNLLEGNEIEYKTLYSSKESKAYCDSIKIPASIKLKKGAQVMVTRNIDTDSKLANGTRGVVTYVFQDYVVIKTIYGDRAIRLFECVNNNDKKIKYSIMPLTLAWALTIHKAQGVTLDCCTIDIGKSLFEYGQAYTALSRVKNLKGLCVTSIEKTAFRTHKDVTHFYKNLLD